MRWEDERYVRIYTRDTVDWLGLSFLAQGLFCLLLRKVDRAGLLKLGKQGRRAVAIIIGFPGDWPRLEPALDELLEDGCVTIQGDHLVIPNFIEAQEATQSDAQRKRESRARSRDLAAAAAVLNPDKTSESVTPSHETGQKVTSGHGASQVVTPSLAVPSVPSVPVEAALLAEGIKPLGIHLQVQCPSLAGLVKRAAAAGVGVDVGRKATLWGEAEGLIGQAGAESVLSCWLSTAAKRGGGSVPLAYLVHPMRDLVAKRGPSSRGPQPVGRDFTKTLGEV